METFIGGLISGVIAVPIYNYLKNSLLPYIYEHTSDNIKLTDKWRVMHIGSPSDSDELEAEWSVDVNLTQKGRGICGEAIATCIKGNPKGMEVEYLISGKSINGVVDISFSESNTKSRNRTVFLLQLTGPGDVMEGYRLFLGRRKNDIRSIPCKWVRKNAIVNCGTA